MARLILTLQMIGVAVLLFCAWVAAGAEAFRAPSKVGGDMNDSFNGGLTTKKASPLERRGLFLSI